MIYDPIAAAERAGRLGPEIDVRIIPDIGRLLGMQRPDIVDPLVRDLFASRSATVAAENAEAIQGPRTPARSTEGARGGKATMQAAVRTRYGTPRTSSSSSRSTIQTPVEDEVLVRVEAASVIRADLDGLTPPATGHTACSLACARRGIPGWASTWPESSKRSVDQAKRFQPGDRVFADLFPFGQGAFAGGRSVAGSAPPAGSRMDWASRRRPRCPIRRYLAVQGLRLKNGRTIRTGRWVLIDGASGNVGPFAVQIAKALGAQVTGTASPGKLEFVRSLGADYVLDYTTDDYTRTGKRYDWILDTDSHHSVLRARRNLEPGGVYITLGGTARAIFGALLLGTLVSNLRPTRWSGLLLWWEPFKAEDVATITSLVAEGKVTPQIDRRFPLEGVADALRFVDSGRARGKVLVIPD